MLERTAALILLIKFINSFIELSFLTPSPTITNGFFELFINSLILFIEKLSNLLVIGFFKEKFDSSTSAKPISEGKSINTGPSIPELANLYESLIVLAGLSVEIVLIPLVNEPIILE